VAQVLQSGKATLRELKEVYTLEDMMNIWEVVYTAKYNEWRAREAARKSEELRRMARRGRS